MSTHLDLLRSLKPPQKEKPRKRKKKQRYYKKGAGPGKEKPENEGLALVVDLLLNEAAFGKAVFISPIEEGGMEYIIVRGKHERRKRLKKGILRMLDVRILKRKEGVVFCPLSFQGNPYKVFINQSGELEYGILEVNCKISPRVRNSVPEGVNDWKDFFLPSEG